MSEKEMKEFMEVQNFKKSFKKGVFLLYIFVNVKSNISKTIKDTDLNYNSVYKS